MICKKPLEEERPLENFHFYKNVHEETSHVQAAAMHNMEHPDTPITTDDIMFGPNFHDFGMAYPQYSQTGFHFSYRHTGHSQRKIAGYKDMKFPKGMFIYGKVVEHENLAEVLDDIRREYYLSRLSIETSRNNEHESFHANIKGIIRIVAAENDWEFEEMEEDRWDVGYLTIDIETFLVRKGSPRRLTLYNRDGVRLNLEMGLEKFKKILEKIGKPISEELDKKEDAFYEYWGDSAL